MSNYRDLAKRISACTTCGHKINDHEANECWNYEAHGEQCGCPWMGVPNE